MNAAASGEPGKGRDKRGTAPRALPPRPAFLELPGADRSADTTGRLLPVATTAALPIPYDTDTTGTVALATVAGGSKPRTGEIVADRYLVTVGAAEGSEARLCPPEDIPVPEPVTRAGGDRRTPLGGPGASASVGPVVLGSGLGGAELLEREDEVERLRLLLSQGRSVRLTGPSGSGRSALLSAVADSCVGLAPDGVVRLSGYRRTPADLLQDLFAATHRAPGYRPDRRRLPKILGRLGAIVVIDDVDFGGSALEEVLDCAPECAFLISARPDTASPAASSRLEDSPLGGISRDACLELLAGLAGRPLDPVERAWAVDLWFESEGLPLRFVQAGRLLRQRDVAVDALVVAEEERGALFGGAANTRGYDDEDPAVREAALRRAVPLPTVAESAAPAVRIARGLGEAAQAVLRLAVALGGECPTAPHLPALIDVGQGESALHDLVECGLAVSTGEHHRLTSGVRSLLAMEWPADDSGYGAAQHFSWWVGHSSVTVDQVSAEAEVLIAAMAADRGSGRHSSVLLLARAAAPAFALALRWGAWEQALRLGLEAARITGAVADEAWFHHELGVLALCLGADDRARAEFDASIALRGALGDSRSAAAARRMTALLSTAARLPADSEAETRQLSARAMGQVPWRRSISAVTARRSRRRNVALAGAGVVLLAVLGTVLGLTTADGDTASPTPANTLPNTSGEVSDTAVAPAPGAAATSSPVQSAPVSTSASASGIPQPPVTQSGAALPPGAPGTSATGSSAPPPTGTSPTENSTAPGNGGGHHQPPPSKSPSTPPKSPPKSPTKTPSEPPAKPPSTPPKSPTSSPPTTTSPPPPTPSDTSSTSPTTGDSDTA